jgi:hypothetical protein
MLSSFAGLKKKMPVMNGDLTAGAPSFPAQNRNGIYHISR